MDEQRKLLDALMGANRNGESGASYKFSDPEVCKAHIAVFCPHDLFVNTKSDMGPCPKIHDAKLKLDYEAAVKKGEVYPYEAEWVEYARQLIDDIDRKIARFQARVKIDNEEVESGMTLDVRQKVDALEEKVQSLLAEMERLAENGEVDASQLLNEQVKTIRDEQESLVESAKTRSQKRLKRVCDVSGAILTLGDAETRINSHLQGKQYNGWLKMRETLKELQEKIARGGRPSMYDPPMSGKRDRFDYDRRSDVDHRDRRARTDESGRYDRRERYDRDGRRRDDYRDRDRRSDYRDRDRYSRDRSDRDRYGGRDSRDYRGRDLRDSRDRHRSSHERHADRPRSRSRSKDASSHAPTFVRDE